MLSRPGDPGRSATGHRRGIQSSWGHIWARPNRFADTAIDSHRKVTGIAGPNGLKEVDISYLYLQLGEIPCSKNTDQADEALRMAEKPFCPSRVIWRVRASPGQLL